MHNTPTSHSSSSEESRYKTREYLTAVPETHSPLVIRRDLSSGNGHHGAQYSRQNCYATASKYRSAVCSEALRQLFGVLRDQWRHDTRFVSSTTQINDHPAYRRIIALGAPMTPLIIEDLRKETDHWFHALRSITGHTPDVEQPASMKALRSAWLRWADERGDDLAELRNGWRPTNAG